jgi:putative FmdB family regulatory protein
MPAYDYRCRTCDAVFEVRRGLHEYPGRADVCPSGTSRPRASSPRRRRRREPGTGRRGGGAAAAAAAAAEARPAGTTRARPPAGGRALGTYGVRRGAGLPADEQLVGLVVDRRAGHEQRRPVGVAVVAAEEQLGAAGQRRPDVGLRAAAVAAVGGGEGVVEPVLAAASVAGRVTVVMRCSCRLVAGGTPPAPGTTPRGAARSAPCCDAADRGSGKPGVCWGVRTRRVDGRVPAG